MHVPGQEPVIQWLLFTEMLHKFGCKFSSLNWLRFVISVPFIADYAVWVLLIVEGYTVTYCS